MIERLKAFFGGNAQRTAAEEEARQRARARLGVAPTTETQSAGQVINPKERLAQENEWNAQAERAIRIFSSAIIAIDRPDQYLATLGRIFDQQRTSDEAVRRTVGRVYSALSEYGKVNTGSRSARYGEAGKVSDTQDSLQLIPEAFTRPDLAQSVVVLANKTEAWGEEYILHRSQKQSSKAA